MKRTLITTFTIMAIVFASPALASPAPQTRTKLEPKSSRRISESRDLAYLTKEIRKELVTMPYFGVFDWLEGNVQPDGSVSLAGQVTRPTLKKDAQRRVEKVEGVSKVVNRIEVLPLSPYDDRIRRAAFQALYNANSPLFRYGQQPIPPIHIIVRNGRLTLKGVVANKSESDIANIKARGISGVFDVRNELRVERSGE